MISSSSVPVDCGLDTMVLVYSLLQGHPALTACELLLRAHSGWFTSPLVLFEARGVLTRVYGEDPGVVTQKLGQVAAGPVVLLELDPSEVTTILGLADIYDLHVTNAVLLRLAERNRARYLATDDQPLAQACGQLGITPLSPLDPAVRKAVAAWEAVHLPPKGLPRVLRSVHQWLSQVDPQVAGDFWSKTGGGSHLP